MGSVTIFIDQPFKVGDLISVAGITGTVEKVGFRSTRVRTPDQSFVSIPNKKMVDTELDNLFGKNFKKIELLGWAYIFHYQ